MMMKKTKTQTKLVIAIFTAFLAMPLAVHAQEEAPQDETEQSAKTENTDVANPEDSSVPEDAAKTEEEELADLKAFLRKLEDEAAQQEESAKLAPTENEGTPEETPENEPAFPAPAETKLPSREYFTEEVDELHAHQYPDAYTPKADQIRDATEGAINKELATVSGMATLGATRLSWVRNYDPTDYNPLTHGVYEVRLIKSLGALAAAQLQESMEESKDRQGNFSSVGMVTGLVVSGATILTRNHRIMFPDLKIMSETALAENTLRKNAFAQSIKKVLELAGKDARPEMTEDGKVTRKGFGFLRKLGLNPETREFSQELFNQRIDKIQKAADAGKLATNAGEIHPDLLEATGNNKRMAKTLLGTAEQFLENDIARRAKENRAELGLRSLRSRIFEDGKEKAERIREERATKQSEKGETRWTKIKGKTVEIVAKPKKWMLDGFEATRKSWIGRKTGEIYRFGREKTVNGYKGEVGRMGRFVANHPAITGGIGMVAAAFVGHQMAKYLYGSPAYLDEAPAGSIPWTPDGRLDPDFVNSVKVRILEEQQEEKMDALREGRRPRYSCELPDDPCFCKTDTPCILTYYVHPGVFTELNDIWDERDLANPVFAELGE